jgi:uncharacterized protein (TIGR00297 family)
LQRPVFPRLNQASLPLEWQSKAVLLLVVPWTVTATLIQTNWWLAQVPVVAWSVLGISGLFGAIVWRLRAGTPRAALAGAAITASLMYATTQFPYQWSWLHGGLLPLLSLFLLTFAATKAGKAKKERLGTGEGKKGRNAAQVAANLGIAALVAQPAWAQLAGLMRLGESPMLAFAAALAALAEAAADTVSSEIGQVIGGVPRLITTLRRVEPGTDGGITLVGTAAGAVAAVLIAAIGSWAIGGGWMLFWLAAPGGIFGLLFDSLLGATLERKDWLNNDAVNFLSTLSAAAFSLTEAAALMHMSRP